jgi:hypothetical protein
MRNLANMLNGLWLQTGNMSEAWVGYTTVGGDLAPSAVAAWCIAGAGAAGGSAAHADPTKAKSAAPVDTKRIELYI